MKLSEILTIETDRKTGHAWVALEDGSKTLLTKSAKALLNQMCLKNGSTLAGRIASFQSITGAKQKACVLVNEAKGLLFLPTAGLRSDACIWINEKRMLHAKEIDSRRAEILFDNGKRLQVNASRRVVMQQKERCDLFLKKLHDEKWKDEIPGVRAE